MTGSFSARFSMNIYMGKRFVCSRANSLSRLESTAQISFILFQLLHSFTVANLQRNRSDTQTETEISVSISANSQEICR